MKPYLIAILSLLLMSVDCERHYSGNVDINGFLISDCENQSPLIGYDISYTNNSAEITTKTDSNGYFHIVGEYSFTLKRHNAKSLGIIRLNEEALNQSNHRDILCLDVEDKVDLDSVFLNHSSYCIINILNQTNYTNKDTLSLYYINAYFNTDTVIKAYPGPFYDNQILDTVRISLPPHVGYESQNVPCYFKYEIQNLSDHQFLPFEHGQSNMGCNQSFNVYLEL